MSNLPDAPPPSDAEPQAGAEQAPRDAEPAAAANGAPVKGLEELLAEAQAKVEAQREAWLRAVAEAENVRKRAQQDIAQAHKFAVERMAESLLPVVDGLEATLAAESDSVETLRAGVELTLKQLRSVFARESLTEIAPAAGDKFDPHKHQAMVALESEAEPNTVLNLMQKGWALHERVLRPALVTVAKAKSEPEA